MEGSVGGLGILGPFDHPGEIIGMWVLACRSRHGGRRCLRRSDVRAVVDAAIHACVFAPCITDETAKPI